MKKMSKENLLYLFILISPILDIFSSTIRFSNYSLSLFLRPIIPLGILVYIFFTDKKVRNKLLIGGIIYGLFAVFHLLVYQSIVTDFSYGSYFYEASYLCNYTYLIFALFLFIYIFKTNSQIEKLKKVFLIYITTYIVSIYLAILTGTSFTTYVEGSGYRGWFNTGGAVGSILIGSLFILLPYLFKDRKYILGKLLLLFAIIIYLVFLLGTRVGLFGSIISLVCYLVIWLLYTIVHSIKINKRVLGFSILSFAILIIGIITIGSQSLIRRNELEKLNGKIPDGSSQEVIYMAYDLVKLKDQIESKEIPSDYMREEQKEAILKLDHYSTSHKLKSTDLRLQQLLYHHFLWHEQKGLELKLVGNGYLTNMGMLTLEMEFIAIFYNFGILGLILFVSPFLVIFGFGIYKGIKNYRKVDVSYMMLLLGCFTTYMISLLAGHTYFNTSVMIVIILLHTLLFQKARNFNKGDKA